MVDALMPVRASGVRSTHAARSARFSRRHEMGLGARGIFGRAFRKHSPAQRGMRLRAPCASGRATASATTACCGRTSFSHRPAEPEKFYCARQVRGAKRCAATRCFTIRRWPAITDPWSGVSPCRANTADISSRGATNLPPPTRKVRIRQTALRCARLIVKNAMRDGCICGDHSGHRLERRTASRGQGARAHVAARLSG